MNKNVKYCLFFRFCLEKTPNKEYNYIENIVFFAQNNQFYAEKCNTHVKANKNNREDTKCHYLSVKFAVETSR